MSDAEHCSELSAADKQLETRKIKLLDPETVPFRVGVHVELDRLISTLRGKHAQTLAYELRMAYARYLRRGWFQANRKLFDALHGAQARKNFFRVLAGCTKVVTKAIPGRRTARRAFTFSGVTEVDQKAPTDNGVPPSLSIPPSLTHWSTIPGEWLVDRHYRWTAYCEINGLRQNVDICGSTTWGEAALDAMESLEVPATSSHLIDGDNSAGQAQLDRLTVRGVPRIAFRRHGRAFSPVVGLNKTDRRASSLNGNPTGEVDMSACFTTLLCSLLSDADRAPILEKLRAGTWYRQFDDAYDEFAVRKRAEMKAAGDSEEEIADRLKGPKIEYQRQCLFSHDIRPESCPLWEILHQNHPAFALLARRLLRKLGPRGFAIWLMQREGSIFVDKVIPALRAEGISVLGLHDGLIVEVQHLTRTREILERISYRELGFVPGVKTKGLPEAPAPALEEAAV